MVINEGKYDSLVTRLAGDILRYWKKGVDGGEQEIQFEKFVVDDASNLEFDLYMTLTLNNNDTWGVLDGSGANTGKAGSHDPMIVGLFTVDHSDLPEMWREIAFTLRDFLRHEIEHLTQGGQNLRPTKKHNVMRQQRIDIGTGKKPRFKYPMLKSEIEPMLQGMYFRAKKERRPFIDVVDDWFNVQGFNQAEKQTILKLWNKYIPSLNLPKLVLKEEEDEFDVVAPAEWNVETLTVGDTITPDMFKDQYRFYDFDLYIKEIGYDDEYEYDDDMEGDFYVTTEFDNSAKKYLHNQHTWWFHEINNYLKPEYKVVQSLSESEEEDFSVEAPPEWNIGELGIGSILDSSNLKMQNHRKKFEIVDLKSTRFGDLVSVKVFELVEEPIPGTRRTTKQWKHTRNLTNMDLKMLNGSLKDNFKIMSPLSESEEDEFDVVAPKEWNQHELKVGDYFNEHTEKVYTRKEEIPESEKGFTYEIIYIGSNEGEYHNPNYFDHNIIVFKSLRTKSIFSFTVQHFNNTRGPKLNAYINLPDRFSLNEEEDEFSVTAPPEWNVTELGVGDYIAPEMINVPKDKRQWSTWHKIFADSKRAPGWKIIQFFNTSTNGIYVRVQYQGNWSDFQVDLINNILKPQYKVVEEKDLFEQDEEDFSVEASPEWNVTDLEVGDYITPEMIKVPRDKRKWNHFHNMLANPKRTDGWKITGFKTHNGRDLVRLEYNGVGNFFDVDQINSILKQYRIFFPTNETKLSKLLEMDDDEFSVEAPPEWNIEQLSNGDTITPDMWDKKKTMGINDEIDFSETYKISKVYTVEDWWDEGDQNWNEVYEVELLDSQGIATIDYLDNINMWLKPEFKVVKSMMESEEDEFSVEAPPEWNVEELGVGDLITPENSTTGNYYLIKRIEGKSVYVRKGTLDFNGDFKPQHSVDFHASLNNLQSRLKPGFVIRG